MANYFVTVPQPCAADWAQLTPTQQGRHCAACAKAVVDFTCLSDAELLGWFAHSTTQVCGRFRPDQLERPLHAPAQLLPARWQAWLAASALTLTLQLLAPAAAVAQRPTWPAQRLPPLLSRIPAPSTAPAPPAPATDQPAAQLVLAPLSPPPTILGGAIPGLRLVAVEPLRPPLLQLEDWLR